MMKLNLGCGDDRREGFVGVDVRCASGVDVVCDIRELTTKFHPNTVDYVLAKDVLEHVQRYELSGVLKQIHAVLKKDGVLQMTMPNMDVITRAYCQGHIPFEEMERKVFGGQEYPENTHKMGHYPASIKRLLEETGFQVTNTTLPAISTPDWSNMIIMAKAIK